MTANATIRTGLYRILDANVNRASEGFRTIEEATRFVLNNTEQTEKLKQLRHRLNATVGRLNRTQLRRSRDTLGDVGTTIETETETRRASIADVVASAAARVQQSLRCLEEYTKVPQSTGLDIHRREVAQSNRSIAADLEQIRYESYAVFADVELALQSPGDDRRERLKRSQLYVLVDVSSHADDLHEHVKALIDAGVDLIQLRDKTIGDRELWRAAELIAMLCRESNTLFIVNDRPDIAAAVDADGVHVGQEELPPHVVRNIVGPDQLVGVSTHNLQQVHDALGQQADYIGCGPVFSGRTKMFENYPGPDFLNEVVQELSNRPIAFDEACPAFAIGGIDLSNVSQVISTGFTRVAVTAALSDTSTLVPVVAQFRKRLSPVQVTLDREDDV